MSKDIIVKTVELSALFPPNTAGQGMIDRIPVYLASATLQEVKKHLFKEAKMFESINYVYAVDEESHLKGVLSIKELLRLDQKKRLEQVMNTHLIFAHPMDTVTSVTLLALRNNLKMIPIVDHKSRLVGAFSSQELLDILNREFSNDLMRLSGVTVPRKHFHFNQRKVLLSRLPWMLVGMVGGLLTGMIIGAFSESIRAVILLAVFIPVIMSTGATSSNQSAMIFLRNLFHGDIKSRAQYVFNEFKVSSALGFLLGCILFCLLAFYPGDLVLAAAVSISLCLTVIAGSIIGVLTPMILNRLKLDPAIGAGPFLTIVKDLIAMTIYFSVATGLLALFG